MKSALSNRGYVTATEVMGLEAILQAMESAGYTAERGGATRARRDPAQYFFTVFGVPSTRETWGWRVEGHHLSLHFTIVKGDVRRQFADVFRFEPWRGASRARARRPARAGWRRRTWAARCRRRFSAPQRARRP